MKTRSSRIRRRMLLGGLTCLLLVPSIPGAAKEIVWTRLLVASGTNEAAIYSTETHAVVAAPDGIYVAGHTGGNLDPTGAGNAGDYDAYVRKYDVNGNIVWTRQFGTAEEDIAWSIAPAGNFIWVVGTTRGWFGDQHFGDNDLFLAVFNQEGEMITKSQFGTSEEDHALAVAAYEDAVYVGGSTGGPVDGAYDPCPDAFINKYSAADFGHQWTKEIKTEGRDTIESITAGPSGIFVAGRTDAGFGFSACGSTQPFVRKYSEIGNSLWHENLEEADYATGVAVKGKNVYVAVNEDGWQGGAYAAVFKYEYGHPNPDWIRRIDTPGHDEMGGIFAKSAGIYVVGSTRGDMMRGGNAGATDIFARKYSFAGNKLWTRQIGTDSNDRALDASASGNGIYLAGATSGDLLGQQGGGDYQTDGFLLHLLSYRPDAMIGRAEGRASKVSYTGDDVYQKPIGRTGQSHSVLAHPGSEIIYNVRIQNDGDATDDFTLGGCGSSEGFTVRYLEGPFGNTTIDSSQFTTGTYTMNDVPAGSARTFRIGITATVGGTQGMTKACQVVATSATKPALADTVVAILKVEG